MVIRKGTLADLPHILPLYDAAKAFLKAQGLDQWQDGYPNEESARKDIADGTCYVLEDNGEILGSACLAFGVEPTYNKIYDGNWAASPAVYGFLHRIAVSPKTRGKGAAGLFFDELKRLAREQNITVIRGDTHRGNLPMQRVMAKNGLAYRGVIYLEDGAERLAYECILP